MSTEVYMCVLATQSMFLHVCILRGLSRTTTYQTCLIVFDSHAVERATAGFPHNNQLVCIQPRKRRVQKWRDCITWGREVISA